MNNKNTTNITITDSNINQSSVKIWCAFAHIDFQQFANDSIKTLSTLKNKATTKAKNNESIKDDNIATIEESLCSFLLEKSDKKVSKSQSKFSKMLDVLKTASSYAIRGIIAGTKLTGKAALWMIKKSYTTMAPWLKAKCKSIFSLGVKHNSLAYVKFKCNNKKYIFTYNVSKQAWFLLYQGIGGVFNYDSIPSKQEVVSFKQTALYDKMINRCTEIIKPYLDNEVFLNCLAVNTMNVNKSVGKYFMTILNNKSGIKNTMFRGYTQIIK